MVPHCWPGLNHKMIFGVKLQAVINSREPTPQCKSGGEATLTNSSGVGIWHLQKVNFLPVLFNIVNLCEYVLYKAEGGETDYK